MKVIDPKNQPVNIIGVIRNTALIYLLLDYYNAPGWLWGAIGLLAIVALAANFYKNWNQEPVDIFKEKGGDS